jgi:hypothetical protein
MATSRKASSVAANSDLPMVVLGSTIMRDARAAAEADVKASRCWSKWIEDCTVLGLVPEYFTSPTGDAKLNPVVLHSIEKKTQQVFTAAEVYADIKAMAQNLLPAAQSKLLETPTDALSADDVKAKSQASRDRGSIISKMKKRLEKSLAVETEKSATHNRSIAVRIVAFINDAIKLAQKDEAPGYDATKLVSQLGAALKTASAGMPVDVETE